MPMRCLETDLAAVFDTDDFGVSDVTWNGTPISGGHFDDEDVEAQLGEGVTEIVHQAIFTAASSEFVGIAEGDSLTIGAVPFTVKFWKDDGVGVIEIYLERA